MRSFFRKVNLVLFAGALFFTALFFISNYKTDTINRIGDYVEGKYLHYYKKQSKSAIKQIKKGDTSNAIDLLNRWSDTKKGDRIYPLMRNVLIELSKQLHQTNQHEEMLHWAEIWRGLDDRDVEAMAYFAESIRNTPERRQQGMEMLTQLWQQFPLNSTVTVFYNRATGAEKHKTPAQQAVSQEIERYNLTWNVFWDTGSGFNKKNTVAIQIKKKTEQWNISGKLPTNTKRLRLDPPNTLPFRLSQIKLQIDGAEFDISLDEVKLNMMSREHNWIVFYSGVDPHFYFNVDQYMQLIEQDAADISITFSMVPVES